MHCMHTYAFVVVVVIVVVVVAIYQTYVALLQVIFIDEVDSVCRCRSAKEEEHTRRIKTELLKQVCTLASCIYF